MSVRYDPKGKYFTDVVSQVPVVAWIQTTSQRIHGTVHLQDRLESAGFKLPAEIYGADTLTVRPPPRRR